MQTKYCRNCEAQIKLSARFCPKCGARCDDEPTTPAVELPVQNFNTGLWATCGVLALIIFVAITLKSASRSAPTESAMLTPSPTPTPSATLNLPNNETQPRPMPSRGMPEYTQVSDVLTNLGFQLDAFRDNGSSIFKSETIRFIDHQEFRVVVMGPTSDRVDTLRIQAWGNQTKQARGQLEIWATQVLTSLNRGQLPRDFVRKLYAGADVGNNGVSNGFCNVQVLQKPITLGKPSPWDRITIDLLFDARIAID